MTQDELAKKIVYEQAQTDLDSENQQLLDLVDKLENDNKLMSRALRRLEEESAVLREMFNKANNELQNMKKPSLLLGDVISIHNDKAIVKLPNGNKFYSYISSDIKDLQPGQAVLVDQKAINIVKRIDIHSGNDVEKFVIIAKPKESWKQIGGLKREIEEVKEVIELPLKKPKLFEKVGISPPRGILLHGPPGTGKTLLAKAVAHSTNATFIQVVGSELVQKFIGEGAKLVKDIFALARKKAPAIVFIDEIDSLAAMRMDTGTSGEREVNRTFMQLLAEIDGFKPLDNVKIIGATNRLDILDPAIVRPGRLDRLLEVDLPDEKSRLAILKVHTKKMTLAKGIKLKEIAKLTDKFSGAELKAVCMEAGYFAIRASRDHIEKEDLVSAVEKVKRKEEEDHEHKKLFG